MLEPPRHVFVGRQVWTASRGELLIKVAVDLMHSIQQLPQLFDGAAPAATVRLRRHWDTQLTFEASSRGRLRARQRAHKLRDHQAEFLLAPASQGARFLPSRPAPGRRLVRLGSWFQLLSMQKFYAREDVSTEDVRTSSDKARAL
eukprot:753021-Hanusia_phi.AAC.7